MVNQVYHCSRRTIRALKALGIHLMTTLVQPSKQATMYLHHGIFKKRCSLLFASVITMQTFLLGPAHARQRYTSTNGFATIIFGSECSIRKPTGFYQFRDGTKGTLTSLDCSQQGGDVFTHRFYDTAGRERCQGVMTTIYGGRSRYGLETRWEVKSAVPGFSCPQAGKSFKLDMNYPPTTIN